MVGAGGGLRRDQSVLSDLCSSRLDEVKNIAAYRSVPSLCDFAFRIFRFTGKPRAALHAGDVSDCDRLCRLCAGLDAKFTTSLAVNRSCESGCERARKAIQWRAGCPWDPFAPDSAWLPPERVDHPRNVDQKSAHGLFSG